MGAPQAGRRDHREPITLLLVGCLTHHHVSFRQDVTLGHRDFRWDAGGARERGIFYFMVWGGTSPHTILDPETECTKPIQSLNNYQLTTIYLSVYLKTGLNLLRSAAHPFEKRLRRDKFDNIVDVRHCGVKGSLDG